MRVVGGIAGGVRLVAPPGRGTRPTSERAREGLYSTLQQLVPAAVVLDLYAGSGALGIEALSRGAGRAVFVERNRRALRCLRDNLTRTRLADRALVCAVAAERFCRAPRGGPFDLVLCDPPYEEPLATVWARLQELGQAGALRAGTTVVVERDRRDPHLDAAPPRFLASERQRSYGDTVLQYLVVQEVPMARSGRQG